MSADDRRLRIEDYVEHMLEATRLARTYTDGLTKPEFLEDKRTQRAVILNLITIGEAAARICSNHAVFVTAHADVAWHQMRGMRNRMAHGYFDINLDVVWDTIQRSLPELKRQLMALRAN